MNDKPQNRKATGKSTRDDKGRFVPGISGNPGGRPCIPADLKALAQANGPRALQIALDLMDNAESEQVQLAAAREILDRGYGKAAQAVDVTSNGEQLQPVQFINVHAIGEEK